VTASRRTSATASTLRRASLRSRYPSCR
jgi:hypothetical protein